MTQLAVLAAAVFGGLGISQRLLTSESSLRSALITLRIAQPG